MRGTEITLKVKNYQFSQTQGAYLIHTSTFIARKTPEYPNAEHYTFVGVEIVRIGEDQRTEFLRHIRETQWHQSDKRTETTTLYDQEFPQEVIDWFRALESTTTRAGTLSIRVPEDFEI